MTDKPVHNLLGLFKIRRKGPGLLSGRLRVCLFTTEVQGLGEQQVTEVGRLGLNGT